MNPITIKFLTSIFIFIIALIARLLAIRALEKIQDKYLFNEGRTRMIKKVVSYGVSLIAALIVLGIWEVQTEDLALYFASIFTVIGVAFFAQWSHLSNVTGAMILYFGHSISVGDEIEIMDKDAPVKGIIKDINLFFVDIKSKDGQQFTLSNTLFLQKIIGYKIKSKSHGN